MLSHRSRLVPLALITLLAFPQPLALAETRLADEAVVGSSEQQSNASDGFDRSMTGKWTGGGKVLERIADKRPLTVKCEFLMNSGGDAIGMNGHCGVLFVRRTIELTLEREGAAVTGTYDAKLRTGEATLSGDYDPGTLELDVKWGGEVNGDTEAVMRIERTDSDTMRIVVTDYDPATGDDVITSDLTLTREG